MISSKLKGRMIRVVSSPRNARFIRRFKQGPTIISYHGVETKMHDARIQGLHVSESVFEQQLRYLHDNYQVISVDELFERMQCHCPDDIDARQVVITFDDGYQNVLRCAAPILKKYSMPFTVFVNTAYTNKGANLPTSFLRLVIYCSKNNKIILKSQGTEYDIDNVTNRDASFRELAKLLKKSPLSVVENIVDDLKSNLGARRLSELDEEFYSERLLNWDEINQLTKMGATIGSHCHQHTILSDYQTDTVVDAELRVSKALIEEHVGTCNYFAYPNGTQDYISKYAKDCVEKVGYRLGFSVEAGEITHQSDQYILPRIWAGPTLEQTVFSMSTTFRCNKRYANWAAQMSLEH